jgi:IclR family acetate operon transcriptional repressor
LTVETDILEAAVPSGPDRYSIRAVDRVLDILDALASSEAGISLVDLSRMIGLPKSSAFRYLSTLERRGHVIRSGADIFRLGAGRTLMRPNMVARLCGIAVPRMQEMCRRFDETINLGTLDGHRIVYLECVESLKAMRFAATRGSSDPIHSSALGKIISASLGDDEICAILAAEGMPALTANTITSPEGFLREVALVREQGYAVDEGENEEGGRCVAVALPYPFGAAISLSAPAARLPRENLPEIAATLRRAADDIAQEVRNASP